jgi:transposase
MKIMDDEKKALIKEAVKRLKSYQKREYISQISLDYFQGNARKTETEMGWGRECVHKSLRERATGIRCIDGYKASGRKRTENKQSNLSDDIKLLADPQTQADPSMKSGSLTYTRITAKAMREALIKEKGYSDTELPSEVTIGKILNRLGYNLKRVLKAKPKKKIKEVNQIFENVWKVNEKSDKNPESLRISIDAKAKLKIGDFSRGGRSRDKEPKKADDHDMNPTAKLVPYGILNVLTGVLTFFFGSSLETSDFIVDCIETWWKNNLVENEGIKELVINLDNGPNSSGSRTQFLKRMTEFSDRYNIVVHLVYYPPYHSKYNSIERCWGRLEEHWNGEILNSAYKAIEWAKTMTWKGINPIVHFCQNIYETGVKLTKKEMKPYENRIIRSISLPKWDVIIKPLNW